MESMEEENSKFKPPPPSNVDLEKRADQRNVEFAENPPIDLGDVELVTVLRILSLPMHICTS